MPEPLYDQIGRGYSGSRHPDPRIAARIDAALGSAATVLNVGAGTGSYEPATRSVIAVEPSAVMAAQRKPGSAPVVRAVAQQLPFSDGSFDAALALLTLHHWHDWKRGISELRRVATGPIVLFTWDPQSAGFWLMQEYFPEILTLDRARFPALTALAGELGPLEVQPLPIPADCTDGFLGAYWKRPAAFLDAQRRGAMSAFADVNPADRRLARLAADLQDGTWQRRHEPLLALIELDIGYRIVIAHAH